jgi:hypothetical protein
MQKMPKSSEILSGKKIFNVAILNPYNFLQAFLLQHFWQKGKAVQILN